MNAPSGLFGNEEWWRPHWVGMPEFVQEVLKPFHSLQVAFQDEQAVSEFERTVDGQIYHGKWIWFPPRGYGRWRDYRYGGERSNPRYPVFIPSKGRWMTPLTIRTFESLGIPFKVVVEAQEAENYANVVKDPSTVLVLPHRDKGLVVTRNWIWDHAVSLGVKRFWTFDDNIQGLYRLNRNAKIQPTSGVFLRAIEDFVDRYENVPVAGMQYEMFAMRREAHPAFALNARVYSNMLIETDYRERDGRPFRNEGFYNDDTDLCLRILKNGDCTVLFYAFLINKLGTMRIGGGMTPHYQADAGGQSGLKEDDGRWRMAEELRAKHPDVTKVIWKWGRWQHHVDYSRFRLNKLRLRSGITQLPTVDEYGMKLISADQVIAT